jgi:hypothetical protein
MSRTALALALILACAGTAAAQVTGPLPAPPPQTNQTAILLFNTMMAVSRAASQNAQNAQAAAINYQQAIQRYRVGDYAGARAAAVQAMMNADRVAPQPMATLQPLPPTIYAQKPTTIFEPGLIGNVAQIDAQAFVGQARGAVAACVNAHDPNANAAEAQLAAAQRAEQTGNYNAARAAARNAVNLCAAAQRAANAAP